jgi:hypothetical protein
MSTGKKGFDPLSRLFDVPSEDEEAEAASKLPPIAPDQAAEPSHVKRAGPADAAKLARILARSKAVEVPAAPPGSKPAPKPGAPDPAALAKALAKAAAAKPATDAPAPANKSQPPRAPAKPAAKAEAPASRLGAAPPPRKAMTLDEALAAAREEEQKKPVAAPAAPGLRAGVVAAAETPPLEPLDAVGLPDQVLQLVQKAIPALAPLYIHKALVMDDRGLLTALWKAHRSRFAGAGQLDLAVAATRVLWALGSAPIGRLVAAYAVTDKGDFLAWVDMANGSVVAAFADARATFGE